MLATIGYAQPKYPLAYPEFPTLKAGQKIRTNRFFKTIHFRIIQDGVKVQKGKLSLRKREVMYRRRARRPDGTAGPCHISYRKMKTWAPAGTWKEWDMEGNLIAKDRYPVK